MIGPVVGEDNDIVDICLAAVGAVIGDSSLGKSLEPEGRVDPTKREDFEFIVAAIGGEGHVFAGFWGEWEVPEPGEDVEAGIVHASFEAVYGMIACGNREVDLLGNGVEVSEVDTQAAFRDFGALVGDDFFVDEKNGEVPWARRWLDDPGFQHC